jgi:hypothetical protein
MTVDRNLPATRPDPAQSVETLPVERRQPISVAFLPLALAWFIVLALTIAAWTFLFAAT